MNVLQNFNLEQVIEAAILGDEAAFRKLYDISSGRAYYAALCVTRKENDAVNIMQMAYAAMYERLPRLKYPQMFEGWFYRIVCKCVFDYCSRMYPSLFESFNTLDKNSFDDELDSVYLPDPDTAQSDRVIVTEILDHLPVDRKLCFLMYYYFGMNITEIATVLGIDEGIIAHFLNEAKKIVKVNVKDKLVSQDRIVNCSPMVFFTAVLRGCSSHVPFKAADTIFNNIFKSRPVSEQRVRQRPVAERSVTVSENDSTQMYSGEEIDELLKKTRSSNPGAYGKESSKGGTNDDEIPAAQSAAKAVKIIIGILVALIFIVALAALMKNISANKQNGEVTSVSETSEESTEEVTERKTTTTAATTTTTQPETTTQEPTTQETTTVTEPETLFEIPTESSEENTPPGDIAEE